MAPELAGLATSAELMELGVALGRVGCQGTAFQWSFLNVPLTFERRLPFLPVAVVAAVDMLSTSGECTPLNEVRPSSGALQEVPRLYEAFLAF